MVDVIILRGAPGSGKSKTAKALSKYYQQGIRMEVDSLRSMVISVDWTNQSEHISMLQLSAKLVFDFLHLGFKPIIVVDTFSDDKMTKYLENLYQFDENLRIKIFGLFTTDEELKRRIEARQIEEFKDLRICLSINDKVKSFKYQNEFQVDTTGKLPIETARIINDWIKTR